VIRHFRVRGANAKKVNRFGQAGEVAARRLARVDELAAPALDLPIIDRVAEVVDAHADRGTDHGRTDVRMLVAQLEERYGRVMAAILDPPTRGLSAILLDLLDPLVFPEEHR